MNSSRLGRALSVAVLASLLAACGSSTTTSSKPLAGKKVEVAAVWSKDEQKNFEAVLKKFSDNTGATATFTSTGDQIGTVLGSRIASNSPPDVAVLPQPGLLHDLAVKGSLKELDSATADLVTANYAPVWKDPDHVHQVDGPDRQGQPQGAGPGPAGQIRFRRTVGRAPDGLPDVGIEHRRQPPQGRDRLRG